MKTIYDRCKITASLKDPKVTLILATAKKATKRSHRKRRSNDTNYTQLRSN